MNRRLLCVHQSEDELSMLEELFRLEDYEVVSVGTGYEAIRDINARPFDLYVLDLWLPDFNGIQLCRMIRKNDPHVPVVFCSGVPRNEDRARALRAGADAYFAKPIDPPRLLQKARALVDLADAESRKANAVEAQAVAEHLRTRVRALRARTDVAKQHAAVSLERGSRVKALKVFVEKGGTKRNFELCWPATFQKNFDAEWLASTRR